MIMAAPTAQAYRPADWSCERPGSFPLSEYRGADYGKPATRPKPKVNYDRLYRLNMVRIAPGSFQMGAPPDEAKRESNEGPVQTVTINYPFEVGKYEITFAQWGMCVQDGGCRGYYPDDQGWGRGNRPVINLSFDQARSYIRWLNRKTGRRYRLLSEAEWEYVARAGQQTPFYTGERISSGQANFNGVETYNGSDPGVYRRRTLPVGQFPPNQFGVHDILGNALEWTQDCWNDSHEGAPNNGAARRDGDCNFRVMKGGSWVSHPYQLRAAKRIKYITDYGYEDYGFRIARTLQ